MKLFEATVFIILMMKDNYQHVMHDVKLAFYMLVLKKRDL